MIPAQQRPAAASRPGRRHARTSDAASTARAGSRARIAGWALVVTLAVAAPARAQLFADDDARKAILDLRARLAQSEEQAKARNADLNQQLEAMRRTLLEINGQLDALRGEVARLRGNDEQLQRDVAELQKRQRDIGQSVDERLRRIEPVKVTLDDREFSAEPDEKRQFEDALALLRSGDFDKANQALAAFQKRWPSSGYADAARFWQGNALYGKRDYAGAVAAFRAFLAKAPDSPRAPEAMLAIANSQAEMKDNRAARKTLDDLVRIYPKSEAAAAAKERLASLK